MLLTLTKKRNPTNALYNRPPPSTEAPSYKIIVCKADQPLTFVSVCEQYVGTVTHWFGGHTVACELPEHCEPCHRSIRKDFKGYMAAESLEFGTRIIVQITHAVALELKRYLEYKRGLLGLKMKLSRATQADTSMLQLATFGFQEVSHPVTPETLKQTMERVFAANVGKEAG